MNCLPVIYGCGFQPVPRALGGEIGTWLRGGGASPSAETEVVRLDGMILSVPVGF